MRQSKWIYQEDFYSAPPKDKPIDSIVYSLLKERNLSFQENFSQDPFAMADVEKAARLLEGAKEEGECIWIYGDYDVDGITSVSLCYLALKELGYTVEYYIPLRDEGYGLNKEALSHIHEMGGKYVVSVDCGISSVEEVEHANDLGLTMIITDHHEIMRELPKAAALINPKREENVYDFPYLAGVGTAFFLMKALFIRAGKEEEAQKYLDLVAIGTVADIVPLIHDNRKLVQEGLPKLPNSPWTGLRILVKRLFPDYETRQFSASDIGFGIAPIFNAAGRLEDAKSSVKLFLEEDVKEANLQIDALIANNQARKKVQKEIFEACLLEIDKKKLSQKPAIVVAKKDFHHGVIGIVASKLVDKFYRPSIVMEIKEDGTATASCRSIPGINIVECLEACSHLLLRFGGHAGAAGFSIEAKKIPAFYEALNAKLETLYNEDILSKKIKISKELQPCQIHYPLLRDMKYLEPFGASNPAPIFALRGCRLDRVRLIGADKTHLMCNVIHGDKVFWNCVWFQASDMFETLLSGGDFDVAFHLKLEKYRGRYQFKLFLEDIKPAENRKEELFHQEELALSRTSFPFSCLLYLKHRNLGEQLDLRFEEDRLGLYSRRAYIASLDEDTAKILRYHKAEGKNFIVKKKKLELEEEHYILELEISIDDTLSSMALKPGPFFQDVKKFLVGDLSYNKGQQQALASIFRHQRSTLLEMEKERGWESILENIRLYARHFHKSLQEIHHYDGTQALEEKDFLLLTEPFVLPKTKSLCLALTEENPKNLEGKEGFQLLKDHYEVPASVAWVEEKDISKYERAFSHNLPQEEQREVLEDLGKNTIYATKDLLKHL